MCILFLFVMKSIISNKCSCFDACIAENQGLLCNLFLYEEKLLLPTNAAFLLETRDSRVFYFFAKKKTIVSNKCSCFHAGLTGNQLQLIVTQKMIQH